MRAPALALTLTATAWAAVPFRFEYRAPEECPASSEFEREVATRMRQSRVAADGELARTITVALERTANGFRGSVALVNRAGERLERQLEGKNCGDVAQALSVMTALAADANASELESEDPNVAADAAPLEPPPIETNQDANAGAPTDSTSIGEEPGTFELFPPPPAPPGVDRPGPSNDERTRSPLVVGTSLHAWSAVSPGLALGGGAFFEYAQRYSARLTLAGGSGPRVERAGRPFRLSVVEAIVDACSPALGLGPLQVRGCPGFELGATRAEGGSISGVLQGRTKWNAWFAPTLLARLRVDLGRGFAVQGHGGAVFPASRRQFVFRSPDVTVFQPPSVGWSSAFGLEYAFL